MDPVEKMAHKVRLDHLAPLGREGPEAKMGCKALPGPQVRMDALVPV